MARANRAQSRRSSLAVQRILDVAVRRIASEGIQSVRLTHIAEDAGVSVSLIHYHFATRGELLEEALVHAYTRADQEREARERLQIRLTHAARIAQMIDLALPGTDEHHLQEWGLWVELWRSALRSPELRLVAGDLYAGWRAWWIEAIAGGVDSGEFVDCEADSIADRALALIDGYGIRAQIDPESSVDWARAELVQYLAGALGISASVIDRTFLVSPTVASPSPRSVES
jgi:AcrR family transcriptional regulator